MNISIKSLSVLFALVALMPGGLQGSQVVNAITRYKRAPVRAGISGAALAVMFGGLRESQAIDAITSYKKRTAVVAAIGGAAVLTYKLTQWYRKWLVITQRRRLLLENLSENLPADLANIVNNYAGFNNHPPSLTTFIAHKLRTSALTAANELYRERGKIFCGAAAMALAIMVYKAPREQTLADFIQNYAEGSTSYDEITYHLLRQTEVPRSLANLMRDYTENSSGNRNIQIINLLQQNANPSSLRFL